MALVVTVAKGVKVDYTEFAQHLALYKMVMRKSSEAIVKEQSHRFAKDMCDFTPPFSGSQPSIRKGGEGGFGNKAKKKGQDAVSRDVRKIFAPRSGSRRRRGRLWQHRRPFGLDAGKDETTSPPYP